MAPAVRIAARRFVSRHPVADRHGAEAAEEVSDGAIISGWLVSDGEINRGGVTGLPCATRWLLDTIDHPAS